MPTEWAQAIHSSLVDVGGTTAMPLSVTPGGGILVARDFGPIPGSARDIVLVQRGAAPAILYRVANPDALSVAAAQESGHWLVVALRAANDRTKGEVPGSSATGLRQIVIVDLLTGAHHSVGSVQDSRGRSTPAITTMAVLNGKVYWDEEPRYGSADRRGVRVRPGQRVDLRRLPRPDRISSHERSRLRLGRSAGYRIYVAGAGPRSGAVRDGRGLPNHARHRRHVVGLGGRRA